MIAGDRPFKGATAADRVSAVLRDDPAPLPHAVRRCQNNLERIIRHRPEKVPTAASNPRAISFSISRRSRDDTQGRGECRRDRLRRRPTHDVLLRLNPDRRRRAAWRCMTGSRAPGSARRPAATARAPPFLPATAILPGVPQAI